MDISARLFFDWWSGGDETRKYNTIVYALHGSVALITWAALKALLGNYPAAIVYGFIGILGYTLSYLEWKQESTVYLSTYGFPLYLACKGGESSRGWFPLFGGRWHPLR